MNLVRSGTKQPQSIASSAGDKARHFEFAAPSKDPVDIRGFLRLGEEILTETWTFQFIPFE